MRVGHMLTQDESFSIPRSWIILDACSTCSIPNNPDLVTRIRACTPNGVLISFTNGGSQKFEQIAYLHLLPITVHFKANYMATILSVKTVREIQGSRLIMDTQVNKNNTLTLKDVRSFIFYPFKNELYYFDANTIVTNTKPKTDLANYFLNTASNNKQLFSTQEIKGVDTSRKLQEYLFFPGANTFKGHTNQNLLTNCEIKADEINRVN